MKSFLAIVFLLTSLTATAKVGEVPMKVLDDGQILVPLYLGEKSKQQYLKLVAKGDNVLYPPFGYLSETAVDTTQASLLLQPAALGTYNVDKGVTFKRGNAKAAAGLPQNCVGILSMKTFRNHAIQLHLQEKVLRIADEFEELNFTEDVKVVVMTLPHVQHVPVIQVSVEGYGTQAVFIDPSAPWGFLLNTALVRKDITTEAWQKLPTDTVWRGSTALPLKKEKSMKIQLEKDVLVDGYSPFFSDREGASIGAAFLKNYILTIDFTNNLMLLEGTTEKAAKQMTEVE